MTKLAGTDMLGFTYDILGEYAVATGLQHLVVPGIQDAEETETFHYDGLEDAAYEYPASCELFSSTPESANFQSDGSSYEQFSKDTEAKMGVTGDYGGFSGSIDAAYAESVKSSSSYYYSSIFDSASGFVLRIKDEHLKLLDAVQAELDDPAVEPAELFANWGTHVVAGVVVGGQCRYWAYGSKQTFQKETDFTVATQASYAGASGSGKYSESSSHQAEAVKSSSGVEVLGGTTTGRTAVINDQDYGTWASSIPYQPAVTAFSPDHLVPIWEFCADGTRRREVEDAFEQLYVPLRGDMKWKYIEGSSSDDAIEVRSKDPEKIVVGFGGNVNTNNNLNRYGIELEDIRTGVREWKQNEDGDFEKSGSVPEGCALTGIALHATNDKLKHLKLYYQRVNRGHSTNNGSALDRTVYEMYVGDEHSGWDLDSRTTSGNSKALGGFRIRVHHGKGKALAHYASDFEIAGDQ